MNKTIFIFGDKTIETLNGIYEPPSQMYVSSPLGASITIKGTKYYISIIKDEIVENPMLEEPQVERSVYVYLKK